MSIESLTIALHHSRASGSAKLVLIGIANHDGDGGSWPAVSTLAKYAGITPRNVQKAVDRLEQLGEVQRIVGQGGDHSTADSRRPNLYRFKLKCPYDCDRTSNHRTSKDASVMADLDGLSTGVSVATGGVASVTGGGVGSDTLTQRINHLSLVKDAGNSTRGGDEEDALSRDDSESPVVPVETSEQRYVRLIHEKCPKARNRRHDFRYGPCGYCAMPKPSMGSLA